MVVGSADRLIVGIEQRGFVGAALNVFHRMIQSMIHSMIHSMTRTAVIFLSETGFLRRNS
jgi:hypothetical protein